MTRACRILLLAVALGLASVAAAHAAGRWSTYIRPYAFTDVEAGTDSVWYATENAGLVLYDRGTGAFQTITREPGVLTSNQLSALALDRSRNLWVATLGGGLGRLSAAGRWTLLNAFDGMPSDSVTCISAYGDTVWIGTTAGLVFWNGREVSGVLPDGVNPSPFASDRVAGVVMTGDSVWVATAAGVYLGRMSQSLQGWTDISAGLPTTSPVALVWDGASVLLHTGPSVYRRSGTGWAYTGNIGFVWRLAEDHGTVLASSETGLRRWTGSDWTLVDPVLLSDPSRGTRLLVAAATDPSGTILAARADGLYALAPGATQWTVLDVPGPVGNNMANVVVDAQGAYVTTRAEGLARIRGTTWTNWPASDPCLTCTDRPNSAAADVFGAMVDAQGRKWFASWNDALEVLDDSGAAPVFTHLWLGAGREIDGHTWGWGMAADPAGGHWIGSDSPCLGCSESTAPIGIDYYDPNGTWVRTYDVSNTPTMLGNQIRALAFDREGAMYVGYGFGGANSYILPLTAGGDLVQRFALDLQAPAAMDVFGIVVHGDSVWVLSADSLRLFRQRGAAKPVRYATLASVPQPGAVHPLEAVADGSVWVAADGGVRVYHPDGTVEDFTSANSPLADNTVRSIRAEPGSRAVWIATAGGLNRYDPDYVPPAPQPLAALRVRVWPNPVDLTGLGFALRLSGEADAYVGAVYGLDGRRVRDVRVAANGAVAWDGRGEDGALVKPGVYFVRVTARGKAATARVVVLR